ncbi:MAG: hypothetical protein JXC36_09750 [Candidatus Atribacteria bacterium]|nr:hypothetical protein [Candidatus Atribacteria bacterium]
MLSVKLIKKDFNERKNIGTYITVITTCILVFLSYITLVDEWLIKKLGTFYLFKFCLILLSGVFFKFVIENHERDKFIKNLFPKRLWSDIKSDFENRFKYSRKAKFIAVAPIILVKENEDSIKSMLDYKEGQVVFIVINPNQSNAVKLIESGRIDNKGDGQKFLKFIYDNFLEYINNHKLKVYLVDYIPSHIVSIFDDDKLDGEMFATIYSYKQYASRPAKKISKNDLVEFNFFMREFSDLSSISRNLYDIINSKDPGFSFIWAEN